ncbi:hypothetical protein QF027_000173 [Streptomyces canus]|nr:hypothetical protein [Streptomyces canus]
MRRESPTSLPKDRVGLPRHPPEPGVRHASHRRADHGSDGDRYPLHAVDQQKHQGQEGRRRDVGRCASRQHPGRNGHLTVPWSCRSGRCGGRGVMRAVPALLVDLPVVTEKLERSPQAVGRSSGSAGLRTGCCRRCATAAARPAPSCTHRTARKHRRMSRCSMWTAPPTTPDPGRRTAVPRTGSATVGSSAPGVVGRRSSTRPTTASGMPSSAGSIASNATGPWPRDTTSLPSATRRPCWSQSSTSGCDQHGPSSTYTVCQGLVS